MLHSRLFSEFALAAVVVAVVACGGGESGPKPLSTHFQTSYIAQLPVEQQADVIKAKSEYDVAQREQAKNEADLRAAKLTLDVAKNEAKAAKLDESSAKSVLDAAKASADMDRVKLAEKAQQAAQLSRNAADERVHYYQGYNDWLKSLARFTGENTYWRESQYELAMARLAQKNNIAPSGFNYDSFVQQESTRSKRADEARGRTDQVKQKATEARQKWIAIQGEADKILGKKSEFPDPMSPKPAGTDPAAGAGGTTIGGNSSIDGQVTPPDDPTHTPTQPTTPPTGGQ